MFSGVLSLAQNFPLGRVTKCCAGKLVACLLLCEETGTKEGTARGPVVYKPTPGATVRTLPATVANRVALKSPSLLPKAFSYQAL